jgi:hypothetical protein
MTEVFVDSGNLVIQQLLISEPQYWGDNIVFICNGYAEAWQEHITRLTDKQLILEIKDYYQEINNYINLIKKILLIDSNRMTKCQELLTYWNNRFDQLGKFVNFM